MEKHSSIIPSYKVDLSGTPRKVFAKETPEEGVLSNIWMLFSDLSQHLTLSTDSTSVKLGINETSLINDIRLLLVEYVTKNSRRVIKCQ